MGKVKGSEHREPDVSTLGGVLRAYRKRARLSMTQMAAQLEISTSYLSRLEHGTSAHPSPMVLTRMAKRLHIPREDLYALTGSIPPTDLPSFVPYLRAKHPDWPDWVIAEFDDLADWLKHRHSLH